MTLTNSTVLLQIKGYHQDRCWAKNQQALHYCLTNANILHWEGEAAKVFWEEAWFSILQQQDGMDDISFL